MEPSRIESLTLVAAVIGSALLGSQSLAIGFGAAAIGNVIILLALFAFDGVGTRSGSQSVAFAGVSSFCLLTPLMFGAYTVLGAAVPVAQVAGASKAEASPWVIFGTWLVATLILFSVDRFRMSSRESMSLAESGLTVTANMKPITTSGQASGYRPAPIRVEPVRTEAAPVPAPAPMAPALVSDPVPGLAATAVAAASEPVATAAPNVTAIPPGREAVIYLNLIGEGLNVLRTVRAENLGRDYYRIADVMPEGEQWEFTPGQVVRCRKKSLSNGKHMVAYEEAPRAQ